MRIVPTAIGISSSTTATTNRLACSSSAAAAAAAISTSWTPRRILFLRHGQAMHNPRAEAAKQSGCSFSQFLQLMKEDDVFDAPLTDLGKEQAQQILVAHNSTELGKKLSTLDAVIASPLTRAIHTADLVIENVVPSNSTTTTATAIRRISMEHFREINGLLLNAKRLPKKDLCDRYGDRWDFSLLQSETDESWTPHALEDPRECANRAYEGLLWIGSQPLKSTLVVTHGGLLSHILSGKHHPNIQLQDGRSPTHRTKRPISARFANAEIREFELQFSFQDPYDDQPNITLVDVTNF
jgi:broad specificity phosphatase PhoE